MPTNGSHRMLIGVICTVMAGTAFSQTVVRPRNNSAPLSARYLLSFDVCNTADPEINCDRPSFHKLYLVQSEDGSTWEPFPGSEEMFKDFPGNVSDPIRRDNTLYIFYNDFPKEVRFTEVAKVRRYQAGVGWEAQPISLDVRHRDGTPERIVEPSAILDDQRRIVLFYRVCPPYKPSPEPIVSCENARDDGDEVIRSATEVEGSLGRRFVVDEGDRAVVPVTLVGGGTRETPNLVGNPDIFRGRDAYYLYLGFANIDGGDIGILAFASPTLRGDYTRIVALGAGVLATGVNAQMTGVYNRAWDQYWTYDPGLGNEGKKTILRAVHLDVSTPLIAGYFRPVIEIKNLPGLEDRPGFSFIGGEVAIVENEP